jgi:hypothetical protein
MTYQADGLPRSCAGSRRGRVRTGAPSLAVFSLLAFAGTATARAESNDTPALRRFALVTSSNNGGAGRVALRFANSDAESLARVLSSLGGVQSRDVLLVQEATRSGLLTAFAQVKKEIAAERRPQVRRELFVYYSGHSDEDGLLLGGDRIGYQELRRWIEESGADVRIVVLDSCASGALIRQKGGVHRQAFLSDASTKARGHAFLTASSADEAAQESDRIGAAFFTHYLVSGMRGAADANHDQRVTLNEAYQFAYNETLHRTETSRSGAQHPAYDFQLAGTGDLVVTDLHASGSRLVLDRDLFGRIYVRDANDHLLAELRKEPGYPVELGLEAGKYRVVLDADGRIYEAKAILSENGRAEVGKTQFAEVTPMVSTRRGDEPPGIRQPPMGPNLPAPKEYKDVDFDMVLAPGVRLSGPSDLPVRHHLVLGVIGHSDSLHGLQLSLAGNIAQYEMVGAQMAGFYQLTYGQARGLQLGWGVNMALAGLTGAQIAWLANIANGDLRGFQGAIFNYNRGSVHGASLGLVNLNVGVQHGAQIGLVNMAKNEVHGAQVGLVNLTLAARDSHGARVGLVNVDRSVNDMHGAMVGLVNVGWNINGTQVGLVNVANEIKGAQVGLVNFARKNDGASIALLPMVLDGYNHAALWFSDNSFVNVGAKLGTHHVYVVLGAGMTRDRSPENHRMFSSTWGIGGHITPFAGPLFFDVDLVGTALHGRGDWNDEDRNLNSLRLQAGWQLAPHLALVAGPTLNVQVAEDDADRAPRMVGPMEKVWHHNGYTVRMYPGLVAGLQF